MSTEVWFAPGRANLMGEHTDYNEGFVLPFALAQGVTATATARGDGLLVLRSKQRPTEPVTLSLDSLAPGSVAGWAAYPAGVAWALGAAGFDIDGASIDIGSDLPVGAGVSSSAALECSVALALCSLSGLAVPRVELATIAKRAENDFVGAPTGIIDQSAALLCQADHAMLLDCRTPPPPRSRSGRPRPGRPALIVDTRVTHALVSGEYAARRAECEEAARLLGVPALGRLADPGALRSSPIRCSAAEPGTSSPTASAPGPSRRPCRMPDCARDLPVDRGIADRGARVAPGRLRSLLAPGGRRGGRRHRGRRLRREDDRRRLRRLGPRPDARENACPRCGSALADAFASSDWTPRSSSRPSRPRPPAGSARSPRPRLPPDVRNRTYTRRRAGL